MNQNASRALVSTRFTIRRLINVNKDVKFLIARDVKLVLLNVNNANKAMLFMNGTTTASFRPSKIAKFFTIGKIINFDAAFAGKDSFLPNMVYNAYFWVVLKFGIVSSAPIIILNASNAPSDIPLLTGSAKLIHAIFQTAYIATKMELVSKVNQNFTSHQAFFTIFLAI